MELEVAVDEFAHAGAEVGGGGGIEAEAWDIGGGGGNDGADLDFARFLFCGVTRFGHIHFAFLVDGDVVGADSCGDESGGDRVDDFAAGAGAGVAAGIDFDGDGIVGIDAEFFPSVGGIRFSGESGEEGGDGIFDCFWVGIEIGEEGRVFDHGDAGLGGGGGIGGGRVVGVEKESQEKEGEEAEGGDLASEAMEGRAAGRGLGNGEEEVHRSY